MDTVRKMLEQVLSDLQDLKGGMGMVVPTTAETKGLVEKIDRDLNFAMQQIEHVETNVMRVIEQLGDNGQPQRTIRQILDDVLAREDRNLESVGPANQGPNVKDRLDQLEAKIDQLINTFAGHIQEQHSINGKCDHILEHVGHTPGN